MKNFLKGIVIGLGGIAPGLSGSVLMVIFGLYQKTVNAISTLFKNFKENVKFLFPIVVGMGVGIVLFSKIVNYLLEHYEMYTRFAFLGLILGTIPLFYQEVKKQGFKRIYYLVIVLSAIAGLCLFFFNRNLFPQVTNPNLVQSVFLGVAVAGSSIVPGVDSAAILSALGLYELYVSSVATLNFHILIPAAFGLVIGVLVISFIINKLISHFYTATFSVIFGLFLSILPSVMNRSCVLGMNARSVFAILLLLIGFALSFYLGDIETNNARLKKLFSKTPQKG